LAICQKVTKGPEVIKEKVESKRNGMSFCQKAAERADAFVLNSTPSKEMLKMTRD